MRLSRGCRRTRSSRGTGQAFAEAAGVEAGDVMVSVNGTPIATRAQLEHVRDSLAPGSLVHFEVVRRTGVDDFDWTEPKTLSQRWR